MAFTGNNSGRDDGRARVAWWIKGVVSLVALGLLVARLLKPDLKVDAVSLGLILLVLVPWIIDMIASLELPGGIKITFQKVADAIQKVVSERTLTERSEQPGETREEAEYLQQIQDPNLVLTGIRIEIERRARRLAEIVDVRSDIPLARLLRELNRAGAIPSDVYAGLADLVGLGNAAAHGETVESHAAEWARTSAPDIFRVLDGYIEAAEVTLGLSPRSRTIPR